MWLLDVLENQTSSQKREDLSSLMISKKFFFWFKMLRPFQKSHSRKVWNNVSIIRVRACTQGDSFKWSFFALSLKASFPLLTASVAQQTLTLRGCITWGQAGRKQQRCWEFFPVFPFQELEAGEAEGNPPGGWAGVLSLSGSDSPGKTHPVCLDKQPGCPFHPEMLLSRQVQPACSLAGNRPRWEIEGSAERLKGLS